MMLALSGVKLSASRDKDHGGYTVNTGMLLYIVCMG